MPKDEIKLENIKRPSTGLTEARVLQLIDTYINSPAFRLQSGSFLSGVTGWQLNSDGTATFSGITLSAVSARAFVYTDGSSAVTSTGTTTDGQLLIGRTGNVPVAATLTGTADQITVTNGSGTITLSTPQSIGTSSSPTFAGLTLTGNLTTNLTQNSVPYIGAAGVLTEDTTNFTYSSNTLLLGNITTGGGDEHASLILQNTAGGTSEKALMEFRDTANNIILEWETDILNAGRPKEWRMRDFDTFSLLASDDFVGSGDHVAFMTLSGSTTGYGFQVDDTTGIGPVEAFSFFSNGIVRWDLDANGDFFFRDNKFANGYTVGETLPNARHIIGSASSAGLKPQLHCVDRSTSQFLDAGITMYHKLTHKWTMAIDRSDNDYLKFSTSADLSSPSMTLDGSAVHTHGGRIHNTTRITSGPYTLLATDHELFVDTDGGAITVNLPAGVDGTNYRIINCGSSGNNITLTPNGAELLIGANASQTLVDDDVLIITYESTEGWR